MTALSRRHLIRMLIWPIWLIIFATSAVCSPVSAFPLITTFHYGGQVQSQISYDYSSIPVSGYDRALMLLEDEEKNASRGVRSIFSSFAEFLAAESGASSALQGARLSEHLTQLENMDLRASKELENGSVRYYGDLKAESTPGEMSGARLVREWTPETGAKRTWIETLDQRGSVRSVRPETGGPKVHYLFDANGNYIGTS